MRYWVSFMAPHKRARLHEATCPDCRDGRGQEGQHKTGSGATGWNGPFDTILKAEVFMAEHFAHFKDVAKCKRCRPGIADMIEVFHFRVYDPVNDTWLIPKRKSPLTRIERAHGEVIPGTGELVAVSQLDGQERYESSPTDPKKGSDTL